MHNWSPIKNRSYNHIQPSSIVPLMIQFYLHATIHFNYNQNLFQIYNKYLQIILINKQSHDCV